MKLDYSFKNISLKTKILMFFIMLSTVPVLLIGIISYRTSASIIKNYEVEKTARNLKDTDTFISDYFNEKINLGKRLASEKGVLNFMENGGDSSAAEGESALGSLFNLYGNSQGIHSIYVFDRKGNVFTNDEVRYISFQEFEGDSWYRRMEAGNLDLYMSPIRFDKNTIISVFLPVANPAGGKFEGLVILNLFEKSVYDIYRNMDMPYGEILITDSSYRVLSCRNKYQLQLTWEDIFRLKPDFPFKDGYNEKRVVNDNYLITYNRNEGLGLIYICFEPLNRVLAASNEIKYTTMLICGICLAVTGLIAVFLSVKITNPVKKLVKVINTVEEGNLDLQVNFKSTDEIGLIGNAFDSMVKKLRQSISDIYAEQQKRREAEIKVLMLQINPHFLYNTFSSIIWLASRNKNREVIEMVNALSTFFRIGISKGNEIIRVYEEIEHAKSYLAIQKIRYKDEFEYEVDSDTEIEQLYTPKLLLQPVLENSIYHGIKSREQGGRIILRSFKENDHLCFEVADNGGNMDLGLMDEVNRALSEGENSPCMGIGTSNVNTRIRMMFGPGYGLSFSRFKDMTVARIVLPIVNSI